MRDDGIYAPPTDDELKIARAHAIAHCELCDDAGYFGARPCDHRIHSRPETRDRAKQLVADTLERQRHARAAASEVQS